MLIERVFQRNISSGGNRGEMHVTKPAKDKGRVWQSFNVILFRSRSTGRNKEVIDCWGFILNSGSP